ncbi:TetR/AcrR family transcriptional regulator [Cohnella lubricantis]|uniref:TetR/AcrR family transcriptional regulator n=1 Tax=Cohnella lubricantis TaxID=2163172 RepID=A0A841T4Q6_9BACL|nr:TetR/AcrR family transcriptional regulator [Cohnella lubricantis]MBB6676314.1 TetR/AcrR family transcriptional regulator [Cohnella lubricantis]MBP2119616.1 AcrR family transcriptional regulator [Cohnella lubricantis]
MEDARKNKILDTAIELFRAKGYSSASMQDIAEACGMAKASIYKFFASKEELFTAAFVACHQTLLDRAAALEREEAWLNLSPKEKLRRKVEIQLEYTVANHLFMIDFKELPIATNEHFIAAWKRKKAALHAWRRELLIEAYGDPIEPYVWDVVAIFRGIHLEYLSFVQQKVIALPMAELAAFIVDRMDAVISDMIRTQPKPVIEPYNAFYSYLNPSDAPAREETVRRLVDLMDKRIGELAKPEDTKKELQQVAAMLRAECERVPSNTTLIRVLTAYLDGVPELRSYVRQLYNLLS